MVNFYTSANHYTKYSNTFIGWGDKFPYVATGGDISAASSINLDGSSTVSTDIIIDHAADQYGVTYATDNCSLSASAAYNPEQISISDTTLSATKDAHILADGVNSQSVSVNATWNSANTQANTDIVTSTSVTVNDEQYDVTWNWYESSDSAAGTPASVNSSVYYGDTPGTTAGADIPAATLATDSYYTESSHYDSGSYSTHQITADDSFTMQYAAVSGHTYNYTVDPVKQLSDDQSEAIAYYPCTKEGCDHHADCKIIEEAGEEKWVAADDAEYAETPGTLVNEDNPLPTADVTCGGAAIRIPGTGQTGSQVTSGMRYLVTMDIPEGAELVDFGVMYTLVPYIVKDSQWATRTSHARNVFGPVSISDVDYVDTEKMTFDYSASAAGTAKAVPLAGVSYARSASKANFSPLNRYTAYTGKQGKGSETTLDSGDAQSVQFNCVITGLADDVATAKLSKLAYSRVVRGYVTYNYLGQEFTIYDDTLTSRNMGYIADLVKDNPLETLYCRNYAQSIADRIAELGG